MNRDHAQNLYQEARAQLHRRGDRTMVVLLLVQWALAIVIALTLSPYTWAGKVQSVHLHVQVAIFFGGLLDLMPILLTVKRPGWWLTRHVIAASQMLWSGLLIHLTGGRIESHFHIFGSLAFLAFYRDWTLLVTATVVVSLDHLLRGLLLPESVYGVVNPEWWRFIEHSCWVLFEDVVLLFGSLRGDRDLRVAAEREATLEELNATLEARVAERTSALGEANLQLRESFDRLQVAQRELVDTSRRAGMADAASGVLHNVGNVLNSINVSASLVADGVRRSKAPGVAKVAQLLVNHRDRLDRFFTDDERGRRLPDYLTVLGHTLEVERESIAGELERLGKSIDHVKVIVGMQQAYATGRGADEEISIEELIDDAVGLHAILWERDRIDVHRERATPSRLSLDRHKVFQVLTNLLTNAAQAIAERAGEARRITVRSRLDGDKLCIDVSDTGIGIDPENLARIFTLGFTTKKNGHGLGLHASACSALEMKGQLRAHSDGIGRGATFTLTLPARAPTALVRS